ncbi:MAG TPA: hypothetical protein VGN59_14230 [Acidimicrobiia bacterium]|jgi:hypothetical protein
MATGRSDTRVTVIVVLGILVFGLIVAGTILVVTGRAKNPDIKGSIPYGLARTLKQQVEDGGPYAFAGKTGDTGFWIALEHGKLVALKIKKPGTADCNVRWRGSINTFVDCHNRPIRIDQLARFPTTIPTSGAQKGVLLVNVSGTIPPPASS